MRDDTKDDERKPHEQDIDVALLEHARLALKRIHYVSQPSGSDQPKSTESKDVSKRKKVEKKKESSPVFAEKKDQAQYAEKEKQYLSLKKPVERSIYYQHSKQGMKYWYEEKKPLSYSKRMPMGRKGTLLGLVDAPYK